MTFQDITAITQGEILQHRQEVIVRHLVYDSRRPLSEPETTVFFAIKGANHNGHDYLQDLYSRGVRTFIIEESSFSDTLPEANVLRVEHTVSALQAIATSHRKPFRGEVIGITGSNGKTIVKEWLYQMLAPHMNVVKSPSSYNSQIGVPLSVWQLHPAHEAAIFEAGISRPGEMISLERVIRPTIGIFTNIGSAHDEGFPDRRTKVAEKMKLFKDCRVMIYCRDHEEIHAQAQGPVLSWGRHPESDVRILEKEVIGGTTRLSCVQEKETFALTIPFTDPASIENAMHSCMCMRALGFSSGEMAEGVSRLRTLNMRLELKQGQFGCYLIDDTYNNDLAGLRNALEFLSNASPQKSKSLILSDILQTGLTEGELIEAVGKLVKSAGLKSFVGIGPVLSRHRGELGVDGRFYTSTEQFLADSPTEMFRDEVILIKGARPFHFEDIVKRLEEKIHGTVLEVDLGALTHNLNYFRARLSPGVRVMVMVKAFAYGAGSLEVANLLQYHRVDYLGVAYADEGIFLRRNGIRLPVMVMNPARESFENMLTYDLEPEIFSMKILQELITFLHGRAMGIHLKLDTGMHRLGFNEQEVNELPAILAAHPGIRVESVFSHLAASESEEHEPFTRKQAERFDRMCRILMDGLKARPLKHLLNSSGIIRYPDLQYDMVRLGIGLYGVEGNKWAQDQLQPVSSLVTVISQIREIEAGESVGYGRSVVVEKPTRIATIAIGYADGYSRMLSQGKGKVIIQGKEAPVIGNICMDMTMVDVTGLDVKEGDPVEIFGPNLPLEELAAMSGTIPYEILTNVSQRVKRVFFSN